MQFAEQQQQGDVEQMEEDTSVVSNFIVLNTEILYTTTCVYVYIYIYICHIMGLKYMYMYLLRLYIYIFLYSKLHSEE